MRRDLVSTRQTTQSDATTERSTGEAKRRAHRARDDAVEAHIADNLHPVQSSRATAQLRSVCASRNAGELPEPPGCAAPDGARSGSQQVTYAQFLRLQRAQRTGRLVWATDSATIRITNSLAATEVLTAGVSARPPCARVRLYARCECAACRRSRARAHRAGACGRLARVLAPTGLANRPHHGH